MQVNYDKDRNVKVLLNGVAVSNSPLQSVFARFLNIIGTGVTVSINDTLKSYDVTLPSIASVGSGTGIIYRDVTGNSINLKSLVAGANITITNNTSDITIAAANPPPIPTMANVGTGTGQIYRDTTSNTYNLKTILAGTNITVTNNANDVTLSGPTSVSSPVTTGKKWGAFMGGMAGKTSSGVIGGSGFMANWNASIPSSGSIQSEADVDGSSMTFTTSSTANVAVRYYGDSQTSFLYPAHNPTFWIKFKLPDITSVRFYFGFVDFDPGLMSTSDNTFIGGTHRGFGLAFDPSVLGNYQVYWNNQSSTIINADTGVAAVNNAVVTAKVFVDFANSRWGCTVNNGPTIYSSGTNVPVLTGWTYGFTYHFQNTSGVTRIMGVYYIYGETDK